MSRDHVEFAHAPEIPEQAFTAPGWPAGATVRVLSADASSGALTGVLTLPAGWRRPPGHLTAETEWIVLEGALSLDDRTHAFGYYEHAPLGAAQPAWSTDTKCRILFFARDRRPDFVAGTPANGTGRLRVDTEAMPWMESPVPGPPEGLLLKLLRHVEATGEMTFLCANVPRYDYPMLEFHNCVEEVFLIDGDIWLGNSGMMTAGSYFWRPPFITHGPFYSHASCVFIGWVPSTLVNHVPLGPGDTPEQNLARFVAAGGQRVMTDTPAPAHAPS